jgi:hypothetical protein
MVCEQQFAMQTYFFDEIDKMTRMHSVKQLFQARYIEVEVLRATNGKFDAINLNMFYCKKAVAPNAHRGLSPLSRREWVKCV